jgi:hypothetical protein
MQTSKIKPAYAIVGAVLAIAIAAFVIFRVSTAPTETINLHPEKIPAKGAGGGGRGD